MTSAYHELTGRFPQFAANPGDIIRKYFYFDDWVAAVPEGLDKARQAASYRSKLGALAPAHRLLQRQDG